MGACRFHMSDTNPNDTVGGGGCLCSETRNRDQKGPFAVFYVGVMDSGVSPHLVVCAPCAEAIVKQAHDGELLTTPQGDKLDRGEAEDALADIADEDIPEI